MAATIVFELLVLFGVAILMSRMGEWILTERAVRCLHLVVVRRVRHLRRLPVDAVIRASLRRVLWLILKVYGPPRGRRFAGSFTVRAWRVSAFLMLVYFVVLPGAGLVLAGIVAALETASAREAGPALRALLVSVFPGAPAPVLNLGLLLIALVGVWLLRIHRRIRSPRAGERKPADRAAAYGRLVILTNLVMSAGFVTAGGFAAGGLAGVAGAMLVPVLSVPLYTVLIAPIQYFGPSFALVALATLMATTLRIGAVFVGVGVAAVWPSLGWFPLLLLLGLPVAQYVLLRRGMLKSLLAAVLLEALLILVLVALDFNSAAGRCEMTLDPQCLSNSDALLLLPTVTIGILALCLANATSDAASVGLSRHFFGRSKRSGTYAGLLAFLAVDLVAVLALVVVNVVIVQAVLGGWVAVLEGLPDPGSRENPLSTTLAFYEEFLAASAAVGAVLLYSIASVLEGTAHPSLPGLLDAVFGRPSAGTIGLFLVVLVALTVAVPTVLQLLVATALLAAKAGAMGVAPILAWMHLKMTDRPSGARPGVTVGERRFTLFLLCFLGAAALRALGVPWVELVPTLTPRASPGP